MDFTARPNRNGSLVSQVTASILSEIRSGALRSLDRLPSERQYAARLKVSRNTISAAYAALEQQGAIRRFHGKGSFVCALHGPGDSFSWYGKVARLSNTLDQPVLELLTRSCAADLRFPLSAGAPSLEVFPAAAIRQHTARVLDEDLTAAFAVAPTEGQWKLRKAIADWTGSEPRQVMITAGAQEAIDLIARCLIEPGDYVVIESPTYPGAVQSLQAVGARLLPWSVDWSLSQLEDMLLRYRPKALFTTPTFQNPTGRVMNQQTRRGLLDLAYRYKLPVLEDNIYSEMFFGSAPAVDSLYKADTRSHVISINTFSKMLAPGLRIGWLQAPASMVKQLQLIKMRSSLFTCGLTQLVLAAFVSSGEIEAHLQRIRAHHRRLLQAAIAALRPASDEGLLHYHPPAGGLYLWCTAPFEIDSDLFHATLEQEGLSVAPGEAFYPARPASLETRFRICFSAVPEADLAAGLQTLTRVLRRARSGSAQRPARRPNA